MISNPVLSICSLTYNHVDYISQAIDGFLSQKTTFPIEIIIGDDCSTDGTSNVIASYQKRFPRQIKHLHNSHNLGMMGNFINTLGEARGKYVALCDGDDYWIDKTKLQQQVNYMEKHPECVISFHNAKNLTASDGIISDKLLVNLKKTTFTTEDLLAGNFIPSLTCVFRHHLISSWPKWFYTVFPGDWPLHLMNSLYGYIHFMDKPMAVYRSHPHGITKELKYPYKLNKYVEMLNNFKREYLTNDLIVYADDSIKKFESQLADYYLYREKRLDLFLPHYLHYLFLSITSRRHR